MAFKRRTFKRKTSKGRSTKIRKDRTLQTHSVALTLSVNLHPDITFVMT